MKEKIITILGPTSTGKSDLAVDASLNYSGEVISADSRQVYKGLDIGTGKIIKEEMKNVPHHMLDVADPKERFTVKQYKEMAERSILDIHKRGLLPVVCGGTGFYISAIIDKIDFPEVPPNKDLRKKYQNKKTEDLFQELKTKDPKRAETIDPLNRHRLIRSLEIIKHIGSVPEISKKKNTYQNLIIGIDRDSKDLKEKIKKRLHQRLENGMLEEAVKLNKEGLSFERMEELGLEYRFMARYLKGYISKDEMIRSLENSIWHYVKRQRTWFKKDKRILWFHPDQKKEIYKKVEQFYKDKDTKKKKG